MVALEILTPLALTNREDGEELFRLWKRNLPNLLPDFYGNWEPINRRFDPDHIEAALSRWQWPFLTIRKVPFVDASIWMRKTVHQRLHAVISFKLQSGAASQDQLLAFLAAASVHFEADFAFIQSLTALELEIGRKNGTVTHLDRAAKKPHFLVPSQDVQRRLPEIYWATYFGPRYTRMLGRLNLLDAPVFKTESFVNEAVLLQLTKSMDDVEKTPAIFEDTRARTKGHLGADAFFRPDLENLDRYRAPEFEFA